MRSFEELYIIRTIDALQAGLDTEILKAWEQVRNGYAAAGYDPVGTDDNNPRKIKLIDPPELASTDYYQWSLEEKVFTGTWGILVTCDMQVQDTNDSLFTLGNYQLGIKIAYQAQYIESNKYAALARVRSAVLETVRKNQDSILYNGGTLDVAALRLEEMNPAAGNRTVAAEIVYNLVAQG